MRNMFRLKSKNPHSACVILEGVCTCKDNYISETKQNVEMRWEDHKNMNKISEPSRYLKSNPTHVFTWNMESLMIVSGKILKRHLPLSVDYH